MTRKIIIIAILLIVIGSILLFLSTKKVTKPTPVSNVVNKEIPAQPKEKVEEVYQPKELTEEEKLALLKNELKIKARNFAERYGSFSTDARFVNLIELKDEMSNRFWQETEDYISKKEKEPIQEFYGITTKVLNVEELAFSEDEAKYLISTQRQEKKGTTEKVFYQEMELKMIKENNVWKIDEVKWY